MNFYHSDDIPEDLARFFRPAPQLGLERTPDEYVAKMVEVFREVRRVLKDDGVLWLNLGDSYGAGGGQQVVQTKNASHGLAGMRQKTPGIRSKDLVGIPWRVAFALQADGWWLRQDIVWSKPNPMPESVLDRCTKSHEYIFMLTKAQRYYFNAKAISEPVVGNPDAPRNRWDTKDASVPGQKPQKRTSRSGNKERKPASARGVPVDTNGKSNGGVAGSIPWEGSTRNKRSVWTIRTKPFTEWGETSRRVRVALDEIDGDTKRTTSPDCPLHGDRAALVPNGSYGEREGASLIRTERISVRPSQGPSLGSEPIGSHHAQDSLAGSSGSSVPEHEAPATSHSTENHRRGRAPATIPPCTPSEKTPACTERIEGELGLLGSAVRTSESNTEPVGSADHPSVQTASRIGDSLSCSCEHYRIVTEQISHFATFPEEIPTLCILAGSRPGDTILDPFSGAGTVGVVCEKTGRKYIGIELNPAYVEMAEKRIASVAPLFNQEPRA